MTATSKSATNIESPFTELFHILKQPETISSEVLPYNTETLKAINQHSHNAIDTLLQGLQDIGQLLGSASQERTQDVSNLPYLGYFIATVSNLAEALNHLRMDVEYTLKQRGEIQ